MTKEEKSRLQEGIAFVFPGQGGQYVGMGKDLYENHPQVKEVFERSKQVTGKDIASLCFEGPTEELDKTANTQIAVFALDYACYLLLKGSVAPVIIAGHSLGEYPALVAAGVFGFEEGLALVKKRAELMEKSALARPGKMIAVLGLDKDKVTHVVDSLKGRGTINVANYNCPGQLVVSGETSLISQANQAFADMGAKRVVELKVSGAFHSSLMEEAEAEFSRFLKEIAFKDASVPLVSNYTGKPATSSEELEKALAKQITGSVKWQQSVQQMIEKGVDKFVELGPGRVLSGLIRRINRMPKVFNVYDDKSLKKTLEEVA